MRVLERGSQARVQWQVPRAGQSGFHHRGVQPCQKAEGVLRTQEAECDVGQNTLTQQTELLALCHADLRQDVDRQDSYVRCRRP